MKYKEKDFTYGVELEFGDCYRLDVLADGATWNNQDNTCVSSNGIANDPLGKIYLYGGEINTRPTETINEQVDHISNIIDSLKANPPVVNYRNALHIHIRIPGLNEDLESCKKFLNYVEEYQQEAFDITESIPVPNQRVMTREAYLGAKKRQANRYKSHQSKLPHQRVVAMLNAKTTQEFFEEHAPLTEKGRMWFFSPRCGINLRQMWEGTNTIEFRHFPGTLSLEEIESSLRWCRDFALAALSDEDVSPREFFSENTYKFPKFSEYNHEQEQVYDYTNFETNARKVVSTRLDLLRHLVDINNVKTPVKDVLQAVHELKAQENG